MNFKSIFDFITRHSLTLSIIAIALYFVGFQSQLVQTLLMICAIEGVALALSSLSVYLYTKLNYATFTGADNELSVMERVGMVIWTGLLFLGVHILAGLVVFGIYLGNFIN